MAVVKVEDAHGRWLKRPAFHDTTPRFDFNPARRPDAMSYVNKAGLEDVVVSTSDICFIDGREGRLIYRGYDVDDLVAQSRSRKWSTCLWTAPAHEEGVRRLLTSATSTADAPAAPKLIALLRTLPKKDGAMEVAPHRRLRCLSRGSDPDHATSRARPRSQGGPAHRADADPGGR